MCAALKTRRYQATLARAAAIVREGGRWGRGDACAVCVGAGAAAQEFEFEARFAAGHGPAVVGGEDGFQEKRECVQQPLVWAYAPVVGDVHERAGLRERPDAAPVEVAERLN